MCIASFVLDNEKFILTFNRDESSERTSLPPEFRTKNNFTVLCPLDQLGGGTWIGYNEKIVACLQNGAFEKHVRKPFYSKSRGLILLDILSQPFHEDALHDIDLTNVEPFTLSVFQPGSTILTILRHDGEILNKERMDLSLPAIIASSTLYDHEARTFILQDFNKVEKTQEQLFLFHENYRIGGQKNQFTDRVTTVSITQFIVEKSKVSCTYFDTKSDQRLIISK